MGQGQVHVVAADQQVVADGHSPQHQLAFLLSGRTSVRSVVPPPTSHTSSVSPTFSTLPPALAPIGQPGIDGRLRLFEQHQMARQAGGQRRFARQLAGSGVERGRHGQHDLLLGNRRIGKGRFPGGDQVLQITPRGGDRRDLRHLGRRVPGQDRLMPIDAAMGQPALGRGHRAVRHLRRLDPRHFAHRDRAALRPRQIERSLACFVLGGQVEKRRQDGAGFDRAGRHQLRNRQHLDGGPVPLQRRVGQHAVGGAQVDADNVFGGHSVPATSPPPRPARRPTPSLCRPTSLARRTWPPPSRDGPVARDTALARRPCR